MDVTILDGGLGQELVRRAGRSTPMWSLQALVDAPGTVRDVHRDFFAAGADIATTNTYAVLPDRLTTFGIPDRLDDLLETGCRLATDARDEAGRGRVAGSLGPIGFSYQPQNAPEIDEGAAIYAHNARILGPLTDLILIETMSSLKLARAALIGAEAAQRPVWIAFSVDDLDGTRLRSGEPLQDIAPLLRDHGPDRVLLNCSRPEAVSQGMPILADLHDRIGGYANGFTSIDTRFDHIGATTDLLSARTDVDPAAYAEIVADWVASGARTVGGCCEISPAHIAELARRFGPDPHHRAA